MNGFYKNISTGLAVITLLLLLTLSGVSASAATLNSQFFSSDPNATQIMAGAPYDMNDALWISGSNQNRNTFAYKILSGLFMLGYQTEMGYNHGLRDEHLRAINAFQARNGLPVTNLLDSVCLALIDQQLIEREQALAASGQGFLLYGNMQLLDPHDISRDTLATIYALPMSVLPHYLQMSGYETVQCIVGQCVGTIKDVLGNDLSAFATPVDVTSEYRFVGAYFDPAVSNARLPSAAVHVQTVLHEYGHYLDGHLYQNVNRPSQPLFGLLNTRGFYSISYDLASCVNGCCAKKSADPMDWISKYAFNPGYGGCAAGTAVVAEDWAESFSMYVASGRVFRSAAQMNNAIAQKYDWMKNNVFLGLEYDTDLPRDMESGCNDIFGTAGALPGYAKCDDNYRWNFTLGLLAGSVAITPAPFSFTAQSNVSPATVATSNSVTINGINWPSAISVNNGEYSINGGSYVSITGTVNNGDTVSVRQTSSASYNTRTDAVLTIGGVSSTFSITTQVTVQPSISGSPPSTGAATGTPYSFRPTATNSTNFTLGGNIPPGLNFDTTTGTLSGTPTVSGNYGPIIISAVNGNLSAALPAFSITVSAPIGSITDAATMATARYVHTATPLPNGKVLVTGGYDDYGALSSAELYDPAAGSWNTAGVMATAHAEHTATLLANGKVLVTGGYDNSGINANAELYDPATNSWSSAASMTVTRSGHTATLLTDGKVLVAGGYGGDGSILAAAVLYDPATNGWSAAGSMAEARGSHSAVLLTDGRVLLAGGYGINDSLGGAELYDPATNSWSAAGSLATPRYFHTATTLHNGLVLVTGGSNFDSGFLVSAELYDPAANSWSAGGSMKIGRYLHSATLLPNGMLLVVGGEGNSGSLLGTELFDPASNSWNAAASLATARSYHSATLLPDGRVLIASGLDNGVTISSAELFQIPKLTVNSIGSGSITADTGVLAWSGSTGTAYYATGASVQLTATPVSGYVFSGWSEACAGSAACQVSVDTAKQVTATFTVKKYTAVFGAGANGSLSGNTNQIVNHGASTATVSVVPASGYHFVNWTGNNGFVSTTATTLTIANVTADLDVQANFAIDAVIPSAIVSGDLDGSGTLTIADALWALRIAVGVVISTANDLNHGDFYADGKIDIQDAILILRKVVGL